MEYAFRLVNLLVIEVKRRGEERVKRAEGREFHAWQAF